MYPFARFGILFVSASFTLAGCGLMPKEQLYSGYAAAPLQYNKDSQATRLIAAIRKKSDSDDGLIEAGCFDIPTAPADEGKCRQQRNMAILTLLTESDLLCQEHVKSIFGNEAAFNITTGTITNVAAGAAAISASPAAQSALSGIAFLSNAERSLVNETVYKNMLITAVTKKISESRSNLRTELNAKFPLDTGTYTPLQSIGDVLAYHQTCSFMYGLQKALDEGTQPSAETRRIRLEQDKRDLETYIQMRKTELANQKRNVEIASDKGIRGANARIDAIEEELLALIRTSR